MLGEELAARNDPRLAVCRKTHCLSSTHEEERRPLLFGCVLPALPGSASYWPKLPQLQASSSIFSSRTKTARTFLSE
jgi:hypothetical protein